MSAHCGLRPAAAGMASPMNELQRDKLTEEKTVTALVVPKKQCALTMKLFKGYALPLHALTRAVLRTATQI